MRILTDGKNAGIVLFYADEKRQLHPIVLGQDETEALDVFLGIALKEVRIGDVIKCDDAPLTVDVMETRGQNRYRD